MVPHSEECGTVSLMAQNSELARLRAEALSKQRSATKKISRLKNQNGVPLSGTKLDPRKSAAAVSKMNTRQVNAYLDRLENFLDRKTQYVADKAGRPMSGAKFRAYKTEERRHNTYVNRSFDRVKDQKLPSGRTIEERMKIATPDRRSARGVAVNAPYDPPERASTHFKNEKALDRMLRDMKRRNAENASVRNAKESRSQLNKMNNRIKNATGDTSIRKALRGLSPEQFKILWNYTTFATDVSIGYEEAKSLMEEGEAAYNKSRHDNHTEYAKELIDWAKKLKV